MSSTGEDVSFGGPDVYIFTFPLKLKVMRRYQLEFENEFMNTFQEKKQKKTYQSMMDSSKKEVIVMVDFG